MRYKCKKKKSLFLISRVFFVQNVYYYYFDAISFASHFYFLLRKILRLVQICEVEFLKVLHVPRNPKTSSFVDGLFMYQDCYQLNSKANF